MPSHLSHPADLINSSSSFDFFFFFFWLSQRKYTRWAQQSLERYSSIPKTGQLNLESLESAEPMSLCIVVQHHIFDMKKKVWWWPSMSNYTTCLYLRNGIDPQTFFDCDRCMDSLCIVNLQAVRCWQPRIESNLVYNHCFSGPKNRLCIYFYYLMLVLRR